MTWHFADAIFKVIFLKEHLCIFFQILLKFDPMGPIDNEAELGYVVVGAKQAASNYLSHWFRRRHFQTHFHEWKC